MSVTALLHESLVEILPDGVLLLDVDTGRFILANLAAEQLLGCSRAELTGLTLRDLARPWDLARLELMQAALDASGTWNGELWLLRADGTYAPTDVASSCRQTARATALRSLAPMVFFRVQSSRVSARLIIAVLTSTPDTSRHQQQCSSKVASARSAKRSGRAAIRACVFTAGGLGTGFGASPPVSRFSRSQRSIVGTDTRKRAATASRDVPISTARTTRQRKCSAYGFIP